jgi:hypothetical protein
MPVKVNEITYEKKRHALPYLMFLKQKRSGEIKSRGCADSCEQKLYQNKEDSSSPSFAIESVLLTGKIDAEEGRDVATVDIPGAFMQAKMYETVYMKIEGTMFELIVELEPSKYKEFVHEILGKKILYVELH